MPAYILVNLIENNGVNWLEVDDKWKSTIRAGGISLIIAGVLFLLATATFAVIPFSSDPETNLRSIAAYKLLYQTQIGFFALATILFAPSAMALYVVLRDVNRGYTALAAVLVGVALAASLVILSIGYSLISLSSGLVDAKSDVQKAAILAASNVVSSSTAAGFALTSWIYGFATFLFSLAMRKGIFSKGVAWLGIVTGTIGIISGIPIPALGIVVLVSTVLYAVWFFAVGAKLSRLGRP